MTTEMNNFLRIANAVLKKTYKNETQRKSWAAKMYVKWIEKTTKK